MATNLVKLSGLLRSALGTGMKVSVCRDATKAGPLYRLFSTPRPRQEVPNPAQIRTFRTQLSPANINLAPCYNILQRIQPLLPSLASQPIRSLTYYSIKRGKRKTVKSVVKRFLRLHCGLWLRRKSGYKKKLWKKLPARRRRLRQHVFCNRTQSKLLDKMTTSFWKRRNWYLNDPYQKYHDRTNLKV
ncbi:hypothetical protein COCON_G00120210 [Conger conger]|uniref:Large ribosomal subunit protein bL35m n=1 Tax=Conger conger TaxID=82655 RepID=A0A9Q1DGM4_CONCO|nr:39S ribosomal protein L35, mitochondrial [Conger conger]KAJ8269414.1 hypothetical protein COCON_G00120210 [Conger conger]